jgi:hypothetical protein
LSDVVEPRSSRRELLRAATEGAAPDVSAKDPAVCAKSLFALTSRAERPPLEIDHAPVEMVTSAFRSMSKREVNVTVGAEQKKVEPSRMFTAVAVNEFPQMKDE